MARFAGTYTFMDEDGDQTTRTWFVDAADMAAAITRFNALSGVIADLISGAQTLDVSVSQTVVLNPLNIKSIADPGSEVEEKALYKLVRGAGAGIPLGTATFTIPAFNKDAFTVPGGAIDRADPAIVAFENELLTGGWQDYRGGDYVNVISAEESFG